CRSFEKHRRPRQRLRFVVVGERARLSSYLGRLFAEFAAPHLVVPPPDVLDIARNPGRLAHQSYNKPYGVARLIAAAPDDLAEDLFVIDPDLIFLRPFDLEAERGVLRASHVGFPAAEVWRRHLARVLEVCGVRREEVTTWDGDHPIDVGAEWLATAEDWR